MSLGSNIHPSDGTHLEMNWVADSAGTISVDRSTVVWSASAQETIAWLHSELIRIRRELADGLADQTFGLLNHRLAAATLPSGVPKWVDTQTGGLPQWREITFPATTSMAFAYARYPFGSRIPNWDHSPERTCIHAHSIRSEIRRRPTKSVIMMVIGLRAQSWHDGEQLALTFHLIGTM